MPHSDKIKYLNSEDATVAHVVSIREEAPTAGRGGSGRSCRCHRSTAAEPEVAKKGKRTMRAKTADAGAKKPDAGE